MSSSPTDVVMPQMGVSVSEGTVAEWRKRPGDTVAYEETICLVSTDKIDTDLPSPVAGVVEEIVVAEGETVPVGTVLARIAAVGAETAPAPGETGAEPERAPAAPSAGGAPARLSPVVGRIVAEHGLDLTGVRGTGRGGRVRKQDVMALVEGAANGATAEPPLHIESPYQPDPAPAAAPAGEPGELSRMRRSIGEHMKRSLETAATCTTWIEVDFSRVEEARARRGLTALPIVARATVEALRAHPALNAWLDGDAYTRHEDAVHLGIAVSLGDEGLIVPVVRDAHELSAEGLAGRIRELAGRARRGELTPDEVRGGTFTITNPGQFGSVMATPVINLPQVGILDLEAVVKRPVVVTAADGTDAVAIRPVCVLGLSWDHRALDGVLAARFLADVKRRLEGWDEA